MFLFCYSSKIQEHITKPKTARELWADYKHLNSVISIHVNFVIQITVKISIFQDFTVAKLWSKDILKLQKNFSSIELNCLDEIVILKYFKIPTKQFK